MRVLLTESQIDAESVNLRGRTPLHMVAALGRENAAAICQLFLESMPRYPLSRQDAEGNTGQWRVLCGRYKEECVGEGKRIH